MIYKMMARIFVVLVLTLFSITVFSQSLDISNEVKKEVFNRDGGKCKCCGSAYEIDYDYIIPLNKGGSSRACNIQLLCQTCKRSKGDDGCCKEHGKRLDVGSCDVYKTTSTTKPNPTSTTTKTSTTTTTNSTARPSSTPTAQRSATQCTGYTKKGTRCRNMTTNPNGRCHLHQ